MASNMRLVPSTAHPTTVSNLSSTSKTSALAPSAPSAPGLPDTLRSALQPSIASAASTSPHTHTAAPTSSHPLEARLAAWRSTQHNLKMEGLRRQFGIAEPVKRGMELSIVRAGEWRPAALGGSEGVHGDVLEGRDTTIEWEDVYGKLGEGGREVVGVQAEMEGRLRMGEL